MFCVFKDPVSHPTTTCECRFDGTFSSRSRPVPPPTSTDFSLDVCFPPLSRHRVQGRTVSFGFACIPRVFGVRFAAGKMLTRRTIKRNEIGLYGAINLPHFQQTTVCRSPPISPTLFSRQNVIIIAGDNPSALKTNRDGPRPRRLLRRFVR